jgi:hypothetical protein
LNPNQCELFLELIKAIGLAQSRIGTRAIWKLKVTCVKLAVVLVVMDPVAYEYYSKSWVSSAQCYVVISAGVAEWPC